MKKTTKEIIGQIRLLLDELEGVKGEMTDTSPSHTKKAVKIGKTSAGCIGAIQTLVGEGFLDQPKTVQQVVDKLKEEGQPYSRALVSMNLLNLVKPPRRALRRIQDKDQWNYIVRK